MKKNIAIIIPTIIIEDLIISSLFVYASNNNQNQVQSLEEKVSQEIKYLNSYLIAILGNFNGLTIEDNVFQLSPEETELEKTENRPSDVTSEEDQGGEAGSSNSGASQNENDKSNQNNKNNQSGASDKTQDGILNHNGKYETKWTILCRRR